MRSRPDVRLDYGPESLRLGAPLAFEVVLESRDVTPLDGITVTLQISERWTLLPSGLSPGVSKIDPTLFHWTEERRLPERLALPPRELHRAVVELPPCTLAAEELRIPVAFEVPALLPQSHRGELLSVEYVVRVHVRIPWWPDRRMRFVLPVERAPAEASDKASVLRSSDPAASDAYLPQLEVALDAATTTSGGVIHGAVAVSSVESFTVACVVAELEACEQLPYGGAVVRTQREVLCVGPPADGARLPFSLALPPDWPLSLRGVSVAVTNTLRVRAEIAELPDDTDEEGQLVRRGPLLELPIDVRRAATADSDASTEVGAPPLVGTERLESLWSQVAASRALEFDTLHFRIVALVGAVSVRVAFADERRRRGPVRVTLQWPLLGLRLGVSRQTRLDVGTVGVQAPGGQGPPWITGRFRAQLDAFADAALWSQLGRFLGFELDDSGGTLEGGDVGASERGLGVLLDDALRLATLLDAARTRIPPPPPMAAHLAAWQRYADAMGGWLEPGRMWIHDATAGRDRFEIGTRWSWSGERSEATVVWLPLERPLRSVPSLDQLSQRFPEAVARLSRGGALLLPPAPNGSALQAELPAPLPDPRDAEPTLRALLDLARALDDQPHSAPYR